MKKAMTLTVLAAASLLATTAMAQDKAPAAAPTLSAIADAMGVREKLTATAEVQAVDQKNRTLTLKGEDGKVFTIKVGDEVRVVLPGANERIVEVRLILQKRVSAALAAPAYIDHTPPPPPREERVYVATRDPGAGRPTKRDRREIDRLRGY